MRKFSHIKFVYLSAAGVLAAGGALAVAGVSVASAATQRPAVVGGLAVKPGSVTTSGVTLGWNKDAGAATYRLVVVNASTPAAAASYDSKFTLHSTSDTVSGLKAGTAYEARVSAENGGGDSSWSAWVPFYTTAAPGAPGQTGTPGPEGDPGTQGPAGTPILYESTGNSTPDLALDMAPGPDGSAGSGGWGWDNDTNKPVTDLTVGTAATFTATIVQPGDETANGSLTLTFDPYDFTLTTPPADGTCSVIDQTQQETCSFTDLAHSAVSKAFVFTPQNANPDATIGVTAVVGGEEATAQFPVQISAAS
jgi:hypothetical protein